VSVRANSRRGHASSATAAFVGLASPRAIPSPDDRRDWSTTRRGCQSGARRFARRRLSFGIDRTGLPAEEEDRHDVGDRWRKRTMDKTAHARRLARRRPLALRRPRLP
jgi:hypothetical protein